MGNACRFARCRLSWNTTLMTRRVLRLIPRRSIRRNKVSRMEKKFVGKITLGKRLIVVIVTRRMRRNIFALQRSYPLNVISRRRHLILMETLRLLRKILVRPTLPLVLQNCWQREHVSLTSLLTGRARKLRGRSLETRRRQVTFLLRMRRL